MSESTADRQTYAAVYYIPNTTGKPETHLIQVVEKIQEGNCPVDGCLEGKYATSHHACEGKGCEECSTNEEHNIVGRVLCKYCGGAKCDACEFTGLYLKQCRMCNGTGRKLRSVAVSKIHRVIVRPEIQNRNEVAPPSRDTAQFPDPAPLGGLDEKAMAALEMVEADLAASE